ncbi:MAG: N-formylglutamate amidohydrolase [Myxococcaceae bacterium]|jgi:predicted N-formylglutamate amidohydrolase|nr:N-formylglutamate amidohydrolase [Myxococcaceae bacterium]
MPAPTSIPHVVDVLTFRGAQAGPTPNLLIEIPHGATRTADFDDVAQRLTSRLPEGLVDFFHVNTDAGAPELGVALAHRLIKDDPTKSVAMLRCRVPRTFIDCNRRVDASPEDFKAGKVTPGLMPWVTSEDDRALLLQRYRAYVNAVDEAAALVMPNGGAMLLLHTYAPRTVGVEVDLDIVKSLHAAYAPDKEPTWPLRPEVDVIGTTVEGQSLAPAAVVERLAAALGPLKLTLARGESYPLHPSTLAHGHAVRWPGRTLCVEVRRDLLADPWAPFQQQRISDEACARLAGPFVEALRAFW